MNATPLQLKGLASSQPVLMVMEGNPMPQGSGTSIHGESSRMIIESPPHLSTQHNTDKEYSLSPMNSAIASKAMTMDVDDVPQPTDAPTVG